MKICFIPARGGSKRIKNKNLKKLGDKPLINHSIEAALNSNVFDKVYVSSDDERIIDVAKTFKDVITIKRESKLSGDNVTQVEVIYNFLKSKDFDSDDIICSMLPTCPFRSVQDIQKSFENFKKDTSRPLVSVVKYDFPIQLALIEKDENIMKPYFYNGYEKTRSQDKEITWHPNGAIYISTVKQFIANKSFFTDEFNVYKMTPINSFDIDYEWQFKIAQHIYLNKIYEE